MKNACLRFLFFFPTSQVVSDNERVRLAKERVFQYTIVQMYNANDNRPISRFVLPISWRYIAHISDTYVTMIIPRDIAPSRDISLQRYLVDRGTYHHDTCISF